MILSDLMPLPFLPPEPVGPRALMRTVWRYGDSIRENARVIRNVRGAYNVLLRVDDDVRWRVLAGCWRFRHDALAALLIHATKQKALRL